MPGATFAPIGKPGVVQAARDFQAQPERQTYNRADKVKAENPPHVSAKFVVVPFAVILLVLLGLGRPRDRGEHPLRRRRGCQRTRGPWTARRLACRVMESGTRPRHRS